MTDCKEEQESELEALEAIYADDYDRQGDSEPARFHIQLKAESNEDIKVQLVVEYTTNYPEEAPVITVQPLSNIAKDKTEKITKALREVARDNLGAVMVFTLVSSTLEFLENLPDANVVVEEEDSGGIKKPVVDDSIAIKHGTMMSQELFKDWKKSFDVERAGWGAAKRLAKEKEMELKKGRLTGREFFNKNSANIDWDLFTAEDEDLDDMDFGEDSEEEGAEA